MKNIAFWWAIAGLCVITGILKLLALKVLGALVFFGCAAIAVSYGRRALKTFKEASRGNKDSQP